MSHAPASQGGVLQMLGINQRVRVELRRGGKWSRSVSRGRSSPRQIPGAVPTQGRTLPLSRHLLYNCLATEGQRDSIICPS